MSYTKTNWVNGSAPPISAENLNKIEQGIYDNDSQIGVVDAKVDAVDAKIVPIQAGFLQFDSIAANAYQEKEVTFSPAFSAAPKVICALVSTSTAGAFGSVTCAVNTITKNGCKFRVFNNSGAARTPSIEWVAVLA